ncbi:MmcQ/YjbR family DNA-binding protein [Actinophytocola sp. NPDC049390]|uniref:MmcQ/YjbR family DNA-binding protein n=1 Tax=Actinophytocola sp. NPDC049390 TaxID=3363894 RepID=UPI0037AE6F7D
MPDRPDVPDDVLDRLRARCLALPGAYEERAWVGTRWMVRKKTFAHVLGISDEYPPAYAREAPYVGDATVLTFRSRGDELAALVGTGHPFYKLSWHPEAVGMVVETDADWDEIGELLTESYCLRAPQKLVARVRRPGPAAGGPG